MDVQFEDADLERLEADVRFDRGLPREVVKKFRMRLQFLRQAEDERDLYAMKSLHFEALKGKRAGQRSLRLNDQWRLIVRIEGTAPEKSIVILSIEDYH